MLFRSYLETMREVLPKAKIYIMKDGGETLRLLPLGGDADVSSKSGQYDSAAVQVNGNSGQE